MCSTCVDRIFSSGPASCPVPHCGKTLRKRGFHKAFFADLKIEREVDVRKRVNAVFNRREDEFEERLDWNDYLEMVEGLVFDILEGSPKTKAKAEETLRQYSEENKREIERNRKEGLEEAEGVKARERAEKEAARQRSLAAWREDEERKMDVEKTRMDALDLLARGDGDAEAITKQAQKIILKKSGRKNLTIMAQDNDSAMERLTIRGLKRKVTPVAEKPYDPFGEVDLTPTRYVLQGEYDNEWLGNAKHDSRHMAGGFRMQEYYARTMFEAFSGLGVFIEEEVADRKPTLAVAKTGILEPTKTKIKIVHKMEVDDVF
jgi:CDK-activating kinase assembly factor MAT1